MMALTTSHGAMKLLYPFEAPVYTRTVWYDAKSRDHWDWRLGATADVCVRAERESVAQGVRPACQQLLTRDQFIELMPWAHRAGVIQRCLKKVAYFEGFAHRYEVGDDFWITAFARKEEDLVEHGNSFGYPTCCQERFDHLFPTVLDQMWQWADDAPALPVIGPTTPTFVRKLVASPYTNMLLRYITIRFAPHIPCRASCEPSIALGKAMRDVMLSVKGGKDAVEWAEELLSGELVWDCYRGAAVVKVDHAGFMLHIGSTGSAHRYIVRTRA